MVARGSSKAAKRLLALAGDPPTVKDAVRTVATRLLEGVATPPTDLLAVADRLNVVSIESRNLHYDGHLLQDGNGGFAIEIADNAHEHRRRFTIAHELGHAVFATTGPGFPRNGQELEKLCNMIATELLMPTDVFLRNIPKVVTMRTILATARMFQTSISATALRFGELTNNTLVFECSDTDVVWSRAPFIKRGPFPMTEPALGKLVLHALAHKRFHGVVVLYRPGAFGWWHADGLRLDRNRCLFLLRRAKQEEIEQQRESLIA